MADFTPTQAAMLRVLADGYAHSREELHACLRDELSPLSNIQHHIKSIRKVLRAHGQDIICEWRNWRPYYRHVRLLADAARGTR